MTNAEICRIVGFVGVDVQDTILYLSRILLHMGKKVLMVDHSISEALLSSIPLIPEYDVYHGKAEYRGTFFTCDKVSEKDLDEYDVILLFLGFEISNDLELCTHVIYTTDDEKNHMDKLMKTGMKSGDYRQLVLRNVSLKNKYRTEAATVGTVREECCYVRNDNRTEKKLRADCQYRNSFSFRGISAGYKKYLRDTIEALYPFETAKKEFIKIYKKAEAGE